MQGVKIAVDEEHAGGPYVVSCPNSPRWEELELRTESIFLCSSDSQPGTSQEQRQAQVLQQYVFFLSLEASWRNYNW